ncbi:acylneuraminate cytidylyltransferase [Agromyces larvae]|uniref:N-acylneuraminate cytidylyltransferase n=1 Tax=Agromyces larvae TaxID=2929802 RepID=A0ABY4BXB9_9MICO|nr:acylneuraminate cytidylyltransferase [Agromyces larvae]UOE42511.1 acylneuraminate cytidylyltransferase [Agromyces larvae]
MPADAPLRRVTAIIPARGGSQGLPGKNVARVGGLPLVARAVGAALAAKHIDLVVVSTDDPVIADVAHAAGAEIVERPAELAGPDASSESALLHALDALGGEDAPDIVVFIQATSPFIRPADLDRAIERVAAGEHDSVFSAALTHRFLWRTDATGAAYGVNHEPRRRPRRQERAAEWLETGAFYVLDADGFRRAGHRFFGRVGLEPVDPRTAIEVDDPHDLELARALAPTLDGGLPGSAPPIVDVDAVVTDFDGVHTDDTATVDEHGVESVRVSRADGQGVARLRRAGIPVLILSAEENPVVARRARKLGVECRQAVGRKGEALAEWALARGIPLDRIAYLGNDLGDLPALALAGWPVAVADAVPEVREAARLVLERAGGHGAVRELADLVLGARARREPDASDSPEASDSPATSGPRDATAVPFDPDFLPVAR